MDTLSISASPEDAGTRLDTFLASRADQLSRSRVKALILEGAVAQNGEAVIDPRRSVVAGATYLIRLPEPVPATPEPEDIPLDVLFEDEHLILINK